MFEVTAGLIYVLNVSCGHDRQHGTTFAATVETSDYLERKLFQGIREKNNDVTIFLSLPLKILKFVPNYETLKLV